MRSFLLAGLLVACGSSGGGSTPSGGTHVDGTIHGAALVAQDAIAVDTQVKGADFYGPTTFVQVTTYASACAEPSRGKTAPNGKLLGFVIGNTGGAADDAGGVTGTPVDGPGTFVVAPANGPYPTNAKVAVLFYEELGDAGVKDFMASAVSGQVVVTSKDASGIHATFDVTMEGGEHVTGAFDAATCASLDPN